MNFRKLLPYESYSFTSRLTQQQVIAQIEANTHSSKTFPRDRDIKEFEGKISSDRFEIQRIITYRNSFLPVIKGRVLAAVQGSEVRIGMKPHIIIIVFSCFWLGIVGIVCSCLLVQAVLQWNKFLEEGFSLMMLIPFAMFIFGSLLFVLPFKMEAKKAKIILNNLLQAETNS